MNGILKMAYYKQSKYIVTVKIYLDSYEMTFDRYN